MVLAQIRKQGVMAVIKSTGLKGLYNGWQVTLYRDMSFNSVIFTTREFLVQWYTTRYEEPTAFRRVLIGLPAGCFASVVACPLDVIKTRVQGTPLGKFV